MIKLDLTVGVAALAAVLVLPGVVRAELGILVNDPDKGIVCRGLVECGSDAECDGTCEPVRDGSSVERCAIPEVPFEEQALCCIGADCCASETGCLAVDPADGDCHTVSGLTSDEGEGAVLCTPGPLESCDDPTVAGSSSSLLRCFTVLEDGTRFFGAGDCDGDGVRNRDDRCLCDCVGLDAEGCVVATDTGCRPSGEDGGPDSGMGDGDGGPNGGDGGPDPEDAGNGGFDAGTPPDDETGAAGFEGDGGCRVSSGARSAPLAGALLVLAALVLRRGRRSI